MSEMIECTMDVDDKKISPSRRRHERVLIRGSVRASVKVSSNQEIEGKEFRLEILEISPCGLRLRAPEPIEVSAFDLLATIDGFGTSIFLCTSVRWQEIDDLGYQILGVEIINHEACDIDVWCEFQREEWRRDQVPPK